MRRIAEMPEDDDELKPLLRFVSFLMQDQSLTSEQRKDLKPWAEAQGLSSST